MNFQDIKHYHQAWTFHLPICERMLNIRKLSHVCNWHSFQFICAMEHPSPMPMLERDWWCLLLYALPHPKRFSTNLHMKSYFAHSRIWYSSFSLPVHSIAVSLELSSHAWCNTPQMNLCICPHYRNEIPWVTTLSLALLPHETFENSLTPNLCSWSCMLITF